MSQKSIILVVTLFILLVGGMFIYANLKQGELEHQETTEQTIKDATSDTAPYADITRVDARHYFIDGVHTLVGEINFPTPCDLLEADIAVTKSNPELAVLEFNVINNAKTCAQIPTAQRFKASVQAPSTTTFRAKFMGRDIELNLIPAAPGEVPEEFEVFIKG